MKTAIIGSRNITLTTTEIAKHVSACEEIVSGGAAGIDTCAAEYARKNGIKLTVFLPQYEKYGRAAPIIRNREIVDYADKVVAFWDGHSRGTQSVILYAKKAGKPCEVILFA